MDGETLLRETREYYGLTEELMPAAEIADLYLRAIQYADLRRVEYRMAQGQLVARIARERLYTHHKNRNATLREYLKATGLGESTVSDLVMIGGLVGFCDQHSIKIDQDLTSKQWPKLREAIPALRRKVKTGDVKGVKAILRDVKRLSTREVVRAKYRRSRPKLGRGITIQTAEGQIVLVAVLENGWGENKLTAKLERVLDPNGRRNGLESQLVDILAEAIQAVNGK